MNRLKKSKIKIIKKRLKEKRRSLLEGQPSQEPAQLKVKSTPLHPTEWLAIAVLILMFLIFAFFLIRYFLST